MVTPQRPYRDRYTSRMGTALAPSATRMRVTPNGRATYWWLTASAARETVTRDRPTGRPSSAWPTQTASGSFAEGSHLDVHTSSVASSAASTVANRPTVVTGESPGGSSRRT
jgi:hypothetical protein